jgi:hypothetical protein
MILGPADGLGKGEKGGQTEQMGRELRLLA